MPSHILPTTYGRLDPFIYLFNQVTQQVAQRRRLRLEDPKVKAYFQTLDASWRWKIPKMHERAGSPHILTRALCAGGIQLIHTNTMSRPTQFNCWAKAEPELHQVYDVCRRVSRRKSLVILYYSTPEANCRSQATSRGKPHCQKYCHENFATLDPHS